MKDESNREGWEMGRCQLLERSQARSGGRGGCVGVEVTFGKSGGWSRVSVGLRARVRCGVWFGKGLG